jgi:hypothetical protein
MPDSVHGLAEMVWFADSGHGSIQQSVQYSRCPSNVATIPNCGCLGWRAHDSNIGVLLLMNPSFKSATGTYGLTLHKIR